MVSHERLVKVCLHIIIIVWYWCQTGKMPWGKCLLNHWPLRNVWYRLCVLGNIIRMKKCYINLAGLNIVIDRANRHDSKLSEVRGTKYELVQLFLWTNFTVIGAFWCGRVLFPLDTACPCLFLSVYQQILMKPWSEYQDQFYIITFLHKAWFCCLLSTWLPFWRNKA